MPEPGAAWSRLSVSAALLGTIPSGADPGLAEKDRLRQDAAMTPQRVSAAPQEDDQPLLLFCPDQGGWHTGVWFRGKWLAYIDTSVVLEPSHWLPVPADPPDTE